MALSAHVRTASAARPDLVEEWKGKGARKDKTLGKIMLHVSPMALQYVGSIHQNNEGAITEFAEKMDDVLDTNGAQYGKKFVIAQVDDVEEQELLYVLLKQQDSNSR